VVHHKFVGQFASGLGVLDLFVHETVDDADAAEDAEGDCDFLVRRRELHAVDFVAELSDPDHLVLVFDGNAQDVPEEY